jgi:uncharacterized protein
MMNEHDENPESIDRPWDANLEVLGEMLDQLEDEDAMSLEELDGFFAALHCTPELVPAAEYFPEIIPNGFGNAELFPGEDAIQLLKDLVQHHWDVVGEAFATNDFFVPLLTEDEEGKFYGNNWAIGFMRGVDMREHAWSDFLENEEEFTRFLPILALVHELDPDPEMQAYKEPIGDHQREELLTQMAVSVTEMYRYFAPKRFAAGVIARGEAPAIQEKIGRNDLCFCGSGKKYKKCCGGLPVN